MRAWSEAMPGAILEVRYEDLVGDFASMARRIVARCGVPWNDSCLGFHIAPRPVQTASVSQVREPLHKGTTGRWRGQAGWYAPLLEALGDLAT